LTGCFEIFFCVTLQCLEAEIKVAQLEEAAGLAHAINTGLNHRIQSLELRLEELTVRSRLAEYSENAALGGGVARSGGKGGGEGSSGGAYLASKAVENADSLPVGEPHLKALLLEWMGLFHREVMYSTNASTKKTKMERNN
jgi:hypothetical protein